MYFYKLLKSVGERLGHLILDYTIGLWYCWDGINGLFITIETKHQWKQGRRLILEALLL